MDSNKLPLPESWMNHLGEEFKKDYMLKLKSFLQEEKIINVIASKRVK